MEVALAADGGAYISTSRDARGPAFGRLRPESELLPINNGQKNCQNRGGGGLTHKTQSSALPQVFSVRNHLWDGDLLASFRIFGSAIFWPPVKSAPLHCTGIMFLVTQGKVGI
jgi:hypothetical protein